MGSGAGLAASAKSAKSTGCVACQSRTVQQATCRASCVSMRIDVRGGEVGELTGIRVRDGIRGLATAKGVFEKGSHG